jgi:hypothetical protein
MCAGFFEPYPFVSSDKELSIPCPKKGDPGMDNSRLQRLIWNTSLPIPSGPFHRYPGIFGR